MSAPKKKRKREPTDVEVIRKLFPKKVLDSVQRDIPAPKPVRKRKR